VSSSRVECILPSFNLPSQAIASLDTDSYTPSPSYGSVHSLLLPGNATRTCLMTSVPGDRAVHVQLSVQFGLTFDGLTTYSDYGQLQLYRPPRLCFNQSYVTFEVIVNTSIYIMVCTVSVTIQLLALLRSVRLSVCPSHARLVATSTLHPAQGAAVKQSHCLSSHTRVLQCLQSGCSLMSVDSVTHYAV